MKMPLNGDILVFLPGQQEIEQCMDTIQTFMKATGGGMELILLPIFASLPSDQQALIFKPTPSKSRLMRVPRCSMIFVTKRLFIL